VLLIDGKRIGLTGEGSRRYREVQSGGIVWEGARYIVEPELLLRITNANEVRIRIIGSSYAIERKLGKVNIINFKKFCDIYIPQK